MRALTSGAARIARRLKTTPISCSSSGLVFSLKTPKRSALTLVRCFRRRHLCAEDAIHPAHLDLFSRRLWCEVLVEQPRVGLRHVLVGNGFDSDALLAAERTADDEFVARAEQPVRLCRLPVDVDFPRLAGFLRFRPRLEQARDIEPHIEPHALSFGKSHGVRRSAKRRPLRTTEGIQRRLRLAIVVADQRTAFLLAILTITFEHGAIVFKS